VAKAAPDGTTFYWGANGALTINPTLMASQTYDVERDLAPVARLLVMPSILAVNNDVPAKSFAEFVALAKAQPGKLSYASPGVGTPQHIAGELLKRQAGIDVVHVPYRGAVFTDVIGGRVTMTLQNMGSILPVVRQGQLRGLAVTSLSRTPILPDLPTIAESGLKDADFPFWVGMFVSAKVPRAAVRRLNEDTVKAMQSPEVRDRFAKLGAEIAILTPEAFDAYVREQAAVAGVIVKAAGIKAN
jgi:tripartite-type tricarboxylate transporter receptor subunit TctC